MRMVQMMYASPHCVIRMLQVVVSSSRYKLVRRLKCSVSLTRCALSDWTGQRAKLFLRCPAVDVSASCANRAAAAVWSERVAVTTPVSDQRLVRLIHALRWNEVQPGVVCKLQTRLFWD